MAFQRGRRQSGCKSFTLRRSHEGLAHIFLAQRRFTGTRVSTVKISPCCYAACSGAEVSANSAENLFSPLLIA